MDALIRTLAGRGHGYRPDRVRLRDRDIGVTRTREASTPSTNGPKDQALSARHGCGLPRHPAAATECPGVSPHSPPGRNDRGGFGLTVVWDLFQIGLTKPILNRLTGERQDLSQFAGLQGNLGTLLVLLALSWTLAAVGEETVYRGYIPRRVSDVFGENITGSFIGVALSSLLFGLAHTEQGIIGVVLTFLDALFFSFLRWRFRNLWAAVLGHGFNNTIGLITFFFVGPIYALW